MSIDWLTEVKYFWQHIPQNISPVLVEIGPLQIRYYGVMYLFCFLTIYGLAVFRLRKERFIYSKETVANYFVWAVAGVLLGGRLGYVIFYNWQYFVRNPLEIFLPFSFSNGFSYTGISGMSYHGGLLGVSLATLGFCYKHRINFWGFVNFIIPAVPLGYTFGRIGNFLNGELYGRITNMPWGMYFPLDPQGLLRHPSQLYEAFFEGLVLFVFLWSIRQNKFLAKLMFSLYLIGYGFVRFFLEFYRQPDPQLGFVAGPFTMGQVLCLGMVLTGVVILVYKLKNTSKVFRKEAV